MTDGIETQDVQITIINHPFLGVGKVIAAIKELRTASRWGLKQSKDVVDGARYGSPVTETVPFLTAISILSYGFDAKEWGKKKVVARLDDKFYVITYVSKNNYIGILSCVTAKKEEESENPADLLLNSERQVSLIAFPIADSKEKIRRPVVNPKFPTAYVSFEPSMDGVTLAHLKKPAYTQDIVDWCDKNELTHEDMDRLIYDIKNREASIINNGGRWRQIHYLMNKNHMNGRSVLNFLQKYFDIED